MAVTVIEGLQWGDEGKGKLTDYLAQTSDIVVRFQGGDNAGHTIVINNQKFALRSLPSGILSKNITNVIADGVVLNPLTIVEELNNLYKQGIKDFKLIISNRCHLIMPYHIDLDGAYESLLSDKKIGTTKKGIGPCYVDKAARRGIRAGDLLEPKYLKARLTDTLKVKNLELKSLGLKPYDVDELYVELMEISSILGKYIADSAYFLQKALKAKKNILFEGAQGMMLDIDRGTYPFVTSSSPSSNYVTQGAGIPFSAINEVIGISKAYTTRVGEGPFPTELFNDLANEIREKGNEYGTVTRRPRRVGYLDLVIIKNNVQMSGVTGIALTLFDVLKDIKPLKVCVAYELDGKKIDYIPASIEEYSRCRPIYKEFKSFTFGKVISYKDLPAEAKSYIEFIEKFTNTKVKIISLGPDREETIIR